jgi:hypothetical protein
MDLGSDPERNDHEAQPHPQEPQDPPAHPARRLGVKRAVIPKGNAMKRNDIRRIRKIRRLTRHGLWG